MSRQSVVVKAQSQVDQSYMELDARFGELERISQQMTDNMGTATATEMTVLEAVLLVLSELALRRLRRNEE